MKWIKILILFLLIQSPLKAQNIIVLGQDTLVTISPQDVKIINSVFLESESFSKQLDICDSIISHQRSVIEDLENIKTKNLKIINTQENFISDYQGIVKNQEKQLKKQKLKTKLYSGSGFLFGFGIALLILL